jgi:preprotein translocase subunit SecF
MGIFRRLYRGETDIDFIGSRKRWYLASVILVLICLASITFRGFHWGIEFAGGTSFVFEKPTGSSLSQVETVFTDHDVEVATAQEAGSGGDRRYVVRTGDLSQDTVDELKTALAERFSIETKDITASAVSSSWGKQVTRQALIGLAVFLVLVSIYIAVRFERDMAIAAIAALVHDLVLTAGAYSLVGFEVTPPTVVGLLTILGFSLYDTVVVFDKVQENSRGILRGNQTTYPEAANLAINQTLMRSINTSLISLLPVGGLLFVGAGLLGVGTLKDLALVLFVGLLAGAYSSLFLATPWLVDLKQRRPEYQELSRRVALRRGKLEGAAHVEHEAPGEDEEDEDDHAISAAAEARRRGRHGRVSSRKRGR